eukprot:m.83986 g.83986  ORF g.83986 m.83986 type:complete len:264 (+) comp8182_c0_seq1:193-984(+)
MRLWAVARVSLRKAYRRSPATQAQMSFDAFREHLAWPLQSGQPDPDLADQAADGAWLSIFLPAFFRLLQHVLTSGRPVALVYRTFGADLPRVAAAIRAFVEGRHPVYKPPVGVDARHLLLLPENTFQARYENAQIHLHCADGSVAGDAAVYEKLSTPGTTIGVVENYRRWSANNFHPRAGKTLLLCKATRHHHHVFFDDNIRDTDDAAVGIRVRAAPDAAFLEPRNVDAFMDVNLVPVDPLDVILDPEYFITKLDDTGRRHRS